MPRDLVSATSHFRIFLNSLCNVQCAMPLYAVVHNSSNNAAVPEVIIGIDSAVHSNRMMVLSTLV